MIAEGLCRGAVRLGRRRPLPSHCAWRTACTVAPDPPTSTRSGDQCCIWRIWLLWASRHSPHLFGFHLHAAFQRHLLGNRLGNRRATLRRFRRGRRRYERSLGKMRVLAVRCLISCMTLARSRGNTGAFSAPMVSAKTARVSGGHYARAMRRIWSVWVGRVQRDCAVDCVRGRCCWCSRHFVVPPLLRPLRRQTPPGAALICAARTRLST